VKAASSHTPGGRSTDGTAPIEPSTDVDEREPVEVAVGVLLHADGTFLLCSRPPGKVYAHHWEFPGGKVEVGESVEQALGRELHEELGIRVQHCERWRVDLMSYPHARVRLNFCKVHAWLDEPHAREGQQLSWQRLPVRVGPLLRGTLPVLDWLAAERGHRGPTFVDPPQPTVFDSRSINGPR
jgi:8-oxo-dGTP diphosphatase